MGVILWKISGNHPDFAMYKKKSVSCSPRAVVEEDDTITIDIVDGDKVREHRPVPHMCLYKVQSERKD